MLPLMIAEESKPIHELNPPSIGTSWFSSASAWDKALNPKQQDLTFEQQAVSVTLGLMCQLRECVLRDCRDSSDQWLHNMGLCISTCQIGSVKDAHWRGESVFVLGSSSSL